MPGTIGQAEELRRRWYLTRAYVGQERPASSDYEMVSNYLISHGHLDGQTESKSGLPFLDTQDEVNADPELISAVLESVVKMRDQSLILGETHLAQIRAKIAAATAKDSADVGA